MIRDDRLTPELVVDLPWIREVQLSPQGLIAYVLAPFGKKEEHEQSAIWVVPADPAGGEPRQFTAGDAHDHQPRWSPDGTRLAFLSDRRERGTAHIYVMPADGGEAIALTEGKKGITDFQWSPDGTCIAYTGPDEPTEDDERREKERDDPAVFGERWPFDRLRVIAYPDGEPRTLIDGDRHVENFCWHPDGQSLACVVRPTPELNARLGPGTILNVPLTDGTEQEIACITGQAAGLTYGPDARWLLYQRPASEFHQSSSSIWRLPASGGEPERLCGGEVNCAFNLSRPLGGNRLACLVAEGLDTDVAWLDAETGHVESIYRPPQGTIDDAALIMRDGHPLIAVALSLPDHPGEIDAGDPAGELTRRTAHHPELEGMTFGRQEDFHWTAPDGLELDGILIRPVGDSTSRPAPTVVLVHGGPYGRWERDFHLSWGDWGQWLATAGYAVLMPNPRGGFGHGETFAAAARGDVGGADWLDVLSAVDAAVERGIADPERLGIGGWSQGGFMTAWAVTQTNRFKAGVDGAGPTEWGWMAATSDMGSFEAELGGSTPWEGRGPHRHAEISPLSFARQVTTPLLIVHGENDERVPLSQATSFHRALRENGAPVEMVIYPREPHGIRERNHQIDLLRRVRDWFDTYLLD
ncbi:MAG TPA: S9 family peptidase [Chloroflexota bacterium]|nr:S9 family peptidase [Chloroflexota bacterium]